MFSVLNACRIFLNVSFGIELVITQPCYAMYYITVPKLSQGKHLEAFSRYLVHENNAKKPTDVRYHFEKSFILGNDNNTSDECMTLKLELFQQKVVYLKNC